ncbi:MAG TPA: DEAD/DEAH box helicase, partial [Hyphomicrobium sp.]|nr:DEAD/DEAH box helicase [Hyphomicrobium sp.]
MPRKVTDKAPQKSLAPARAPRKPRSSALVAPAPKKKSRPPRTAVASAQIPPEIAAWFERRGWTPRPHQLALLDAARERRSTLLIAPTGAGKTLAGFLPSLISIHAGGRKKTGAGLYTLYISPLKALAADVERNLTHP